jgi:integrase
MPLTDTRISKAAKKPHPYKLTDAKGLYIEIRPSGAKLWRYRYRIAGKENLYALGEYASAPRGETLEQKEQRIAGGHLTLEEARAKRLEARALVKQGIHPAHRRAHGKAAQIGANADTFQSIATEWLGQMSKTWAPRNLRQVESALEAGLYPYIGRVPVGEIEADRLLELLEQSERRSGPRAAMKLRALASRVFRYAIVRRRGKADPAALLKGAIHPNPVQHHKPLERDRIKVLEEAIEADSLASRETQIALHLLLLTFVRAGELMGAEWSEFDLEQAEWRIPAARMKMREQHIVPLSVQAVALLRELQHRTGRGRYLFPNRQRRDAHMSTSTLNVALIRMGFKGEFSAHGFRATASTMLNEIGYRPDVIERQLAHRERNQSRAPYNHAEYLPERRQMMQQWSDVVDGLVSGDKNVLSGRFGKAA